MNLSDEGIEDAIIGVGLNVNTMSFPRELEDKATSLRKELSCELECGELLQRILKEFIENYKKFLEKPDLKFLQDDYNAILVNRDREVMVMEPGKEYLAKALGINEQGELLVQKEDGSTEVVFSGEVSVRGINGYV
jgi:BirA family biotin operon repressor/biotin-[acetyl-CoA-carboxylase] ligase